MFRNNLKKWLSTRHEFSRSWNKVLASIFRVFHLLSLFLRLDKLSIYFRYLHTSSLTYSTFPPAASSRVYPKLEILFVSAAKDFDILVASIQFASKATSHHKSVSYHVIVPRMEIEKCKELLKDLPLQISVMNEEIFIETQLLIKLRSNFSSRAGWVIQQLLKVSFVMNSQAPGVLVIDSDTLLLEPRLWLDLEGSQILTPTWEYHSAYYKFLNFRGISSVRPNYTFVSHHMLMQPWIFREAFSAAGWKDLSDLIMTLVAIPISTEESPFCIEYELYAQYMINHYPNLVRLEKWSNIGFARNNNFMTEIEKEVISNFKGRYATVSLHAYL